ncbi:cell division topological specificity factor-like protein [Hibiscus syriacus]|uniref:Cell division topological specificity factor-like protein n=1 Tax=Hibiscus syriacus TaxID=106335 RepID=A0A6A2ZKU3_HIBSY|nr:cell division topological specificity factor-like protein [Hibiscus syriacus]
MGFLVTEGETLNEEETLNSRLIIPPDPTTTITNKPTNQETPKNIEEALESVEWRNAVMEEMRALKFKPDGSIDRHKARLVGKDFTQTYGLGYDETFASFAKLNTIRVLLSLTVNMGWPLTQLDVKNVFLNGELNEEVYMDFPPGFEESKGQGMIQKKLKVKEFLSAEFELKDLGNLKYFLGMEVARSETCISISQRKYILDLLFEVGLLGCKPVKTPMEFNLKLGTDRDGEEVDKGRYQRLVGRLVYLSLTLPDITFGVSVISQYMHAPREKQLEVAYKILKYLKGTPGKGLHFKKTANRSVEIYTDADWASVEAEYQALSHSICEGIWIQRLMGELKVLYTRPIKMYCNNQAAVSIAHNPVHHNRTKHALGIRRKASSCRYMVVFQYGSTVLFNIEDHEVESHLEMVRKHASGLLTEMRKDDYTVKEQPLLTKDMQGGLDYIVLKTLDTDSIRVIGSVLGQSIALDYFVSQVDGMVEGLADINRAMEKTGTFTMDRTRLIKLVGKANSNLADVILKVGLFERSEIAWREARYAQIYEYLREEYEVTQRFGNLDFKLKFVEHNIRFLQEVIQNRRSDLLECCIIFLLTIENVIAIYEIVRESTRVSL